MIRESSSRPCSSIVILHRHADGTDDGRDARAARSEVKGAMSSEEQAFGAMLGRMANTGPPWPMQTHIPDLTRASRIS